MAAEEAQQRGRPGDGAAAFERYGMPEVRRKQPVLRRALEESDRLDRPTATPGPSAAEVHR